MKFAAENLFLLEEFMDQKYMVEEFMVEQFMVEVFTVEEFMANKKWVEKFGISMSYCLNLNPLTTLSLSIVKAPDDDKD